jgi:hypothetical protein
VKQHKRSHPNHLSNLVVSRFSAAILTLVALMALASTLLAQQDIGHEGESFSSAVGTPCESKPESKLWHNDGKWWGSLWRNSPVDAFHIHQLNFTTHDWVDTGVLVESRAGSHSDVLWDGTKLYIASHQFQADGSQPGNPSFVIRYSYITASDTYTQDFAPIAINDFSTEALTIDKDSNGTIWAAWTQSVTATTNEIRISHTMNQVDSKWLAIPFVLPATSTDPLAADDICALTRFSDSEGNKIGVLWSDQSAASMNDWVYRFSYHRDSEQDDMVWVDEVVPFMGEADDHINFATHAASGRVFVAGKNPADAILLFVRNSNGIWSRFVVWDGGLNRTRPIVLLSSFNLGLGFSAVPQGPKIHVFATSRDMVPSVEGEVFEKTSSMNPISFNPLDPGVVRMRDADNIVRILDCTSTKQNVSNTTGWAVLANHTVTENYWHHDVAPQ